MTSARGKAAVEDQRPAGDVGGNSSRDPFPPQGRVANRVLGAALKRGLCFYPEGSRIREPFTSLLGSLRVIPAASYLLLVPAAISSRLRISASMF